MSDHSKIQWTDATWNPVRGCTKISTGCKHCYAETFAERFRGVPGHPYERGFDPRLVPEKLGEPLKWRKPRRVFVNSMSDLFHKDVPDLYVEAVFGIMALCPHHTFQVLTKRADRLSSLVPTMTADGCLAATCHVAKPGVDAGLLVRRWDGRVTWPLPNVWLGVSVEDEEHADRRIPELLKVPAAVRFLSVEPMLGSIGLRPEWLGGLGWVIVGGESGHGARTFRLEWARSIVEQCRAAAVPCFVKQLGARPAVEMVRPGCSVRVAVEPLDLRDSHGGDWDEWPDDLKVREYPAGA
jgi:protein gp37